MLVSKTGNEEVVEADLDKWLNNVCTEIEKMTNSYGKTYRISILAPNRF